MIIKTIFLLSILNAIAYSTNTHPHDHFVQKQICEIISRRQYDKFNSGMKLKCDWSKFRDENNKLLKSKQSYRDSEFIYEIIFTPSSVPSEIEKYKVVNSGLFSNIRLKSVSFQNLGLVTVEVGAFDSYCCENSLKTLDLSKNHMIRLDTHTFKHLKRLNRLNLGNNHLSLNEENFKFLKNLRYLDLSKNHIQYLPSNLLAGVTELELINLEDNNLRTIDACVFDSVQKNSLSRKYFPTKIDLTGNSIDCDCNVFYLARHRGYNITANCISPSFYVSKSFESLVKEDPSGRCAYHRMEDECMNAGARSLKIAVIVLALITALFFLCTCVCCCKYMSASDQTEKFKNELNRVLTVPKSDSSENRYVDSGCDKARLLV